VKYKMQFIPWQHIADWGCIECGQCCRLYSVVLDFHEWLRIVKNYGVENTAPGLDKLFINRRSDGSCAFLTNISNNYQCGLQHMKPTACQLWPFKILKEPKFGYPSEASYFFGQNRLFVYADPMCNGLRLGTPTQEFADSVLREFVEIAAGLRHNQLKTTSHLWLSRPYARSIFPRRSLV
jgi:Fe-S-cluster containining protein